ncbi:peroxiredoxin family protein [Pedobacter chitinilyticus]|uniref:Redoxin domain-containing protein n=1 Tax=Pedobacter chitinilyticus TaxID=2233776 RepID=A0A443YW39_9SPHI|nr:hypothetical protein [Pedobacter chitinilyticus]RWU08148.1 hypothetical protein DPV69_07140 [Pedobacter chitinilyticus]
MKNHCFGLIVALALLFFYGSCREDRLARMPNFNLMLSDSSTISTSQLPRDVPYLFVLFDADCLGCQQETDTLLLHIDKLRRTNIVFLTIHGLKSVDIFRRHYHMERYPNIMLAYDYQMYFPRHFHSATTPLLAIYDRDRNLRGVFEGQANTTKLLGTIEEID